MTQAPTWEKDRLQGIRVLLRAIADGHADAPEQILARWTWKLARASRKAQDRRASAEFPEAKRLLGALANSRGHRHEENAARLVNAALEQPLQVGAALLASAEGYTPRANQLLDAAREKLGHDRGDRRRARREPAAAEAAAEPQAPPQAQAEAAPAAQDAAAAATAEPARADGSQDGAEPKPRRRRSDGGARRKPASAAGTAPAHAEA